MEEDKKSLGIKAMVDFVDQGADPYLPLEFPDSNFGNVSYFKGIVKDDRGGQRLVTIIRTDESNCYVLTMEGSTECIFGEVRFGYILIDTNIRDQRGVPIFTCGEKRAFKIFLRRKIESLTDTIESWSQELKALAFIGNNHEHVMGNIECCRDADGNIYSIMKFADGDDLFNIIRPHGGSEAEPLPEVEVRVMMRHVISGMMHLHHNLRIVHQDLSPENILCCTNGVGNTYMIHDLGQCRRLPAKDQALHHLTASRRPLVLMRRRPMLGKTVYRAPELWHPQRDGKDLYYPEAADVWSLGCVMFVALTGLPPMKHATTADTCFNAIAAGGLDKVVEALHVTHLVTPDAIKMIQQMLRPDPLERITLGELCAHSWLQMAPAQASP